MSNSYFHPQRYRFLLCKRDYRYIQRWTLPCYSLAAKKPLNQSVSSTCCDLVAYLNLKYDKIAQLCTILFYWTRIYPMDLMDLSPLSAKYLAAFPHVLESKGCPPIPNPILESQLPQSFSLLLMILIRALALESPHITLNPSLLQLVCKEPWEPSSDFHVSQPSEVARYCPSAISECSESACLFMSIKLICWPLFIPRQSLEKDVFQ